MRLKNKKTGEIVDKWPDDFVVNSGSQIYSYKSLAELCDNWEDVPEEQKGYLYIADDCTIVYSPLPKSTVAKRRELIGNYFSSEEEAELAVRKLKAWKRLKDNNIKLVTDGFDFEGDHNENVFGDINISIPRYEGVLEDLQIIFGGEE